MDMTFFEFLLIIIISGFFGGFVSSLIDIPHEANYGRNILGYKPWNLCSFRQKVLRCTGRAFVGIAGAFAVMFFGIWIDKVSLNSSVENKVFLVGLCVVAGTASNRLLPKIARKLEDEFLEEKLDKIDEKTDAALAKSESTVGYSAAINHAQTALSREGEYEKADVTQAIERLENIREYFPQDRTLHIYLGRLYRNQEDYANAIVVLREFIDKVKKEPSRDTDISDAYFNIACYHALMAESAAEDSHATEEERLIKEALDDLGKSISYMSKNKEYARTDPDLKILRGRERFKELTRDN